MKALLIDDEVRSLETLANMIRSYCHDVEIMKLCTSIDMAFEAIENLQPEVIFLDVDMPPFTGFDLLRRYEELPFQVIFVTAFDHYSIDAIKFSALYYLLKPVRIDELRNAVQKVRTTMLRKSRGYHEYFHAIGQNPGSAIKRLVINSSTDVEVLDLEQINYIEALNTYSTFHLTNNKRVTSTKSIKDYEQMLLHKGFFRIHKSYIVNVNLVASVDKKEGDVVILKNGQRLPLAVRRREAFLNIFQL